MTPVQIEIHKRLLRLLKGALRAYEELIADWERQFSQKP